MKKPKVLILVLLGAAFVALAIYYWMTQAGSLPHWLPGYEAGSTHKHLKHGLAAFILGIGCFVWAWFASAPPKKPSNESPAQ